jgi:hypothetical protein
MEETKKDEHKTEHGEKHHTLDKMTVHELREIVKAELPDVTGVTGMKKEHLLEIIKKHRGIEDDKPSKKKIAARVALTVDEMKHKIIKLKADKKDFIEKHDKKMATILRRRIARLKKRIRKTEKVAA